MKRIFTSAIAVAAVVLAGAVPAKATTFPALTLIYVASGVVDNNLSESSPDGVATVVNCSNMSGQTANVRFFIRDQAGTIIASGTLSIAILGARTVSTEGPIGIFFSVAIPLHHNSGISGATLQVLSTQSAVFCSAMLVWAGAGPTGEGPQGVALHMARFNPHPGTVE